MDSSRAALQKRAFDCLKASKLRLLRLNALDSLPWQTAAECEQEAAKEENPRAEELRQEAKFCRQRNQVPGHDPGRHAMAAGQEFSPSP